MFEIYAFGDENVCLSTKGKTLAEAVQKLGSFAATRLSINIQITAEKPISVEDVTANLPKAIARLSHTEDATDPMFP